MAEKRGMSLMNVPFSLMIYWQKIIRAENLNFLHSEQITYNPQKWAPKEKQDFSECDKNKKKSWILI